jgi:hypothetical protein
MPENGGAEAPSQESNGDGRTRAAGGWVLVGIRPGCHAAFPQPMHAFDFWEFPGRLVVVVAALLLLGLVPGWLIARAIRRARRKPSAGSNVAPLSTEVQGSSMFAGVFFGLFGLVGVAVLIPLVVLPLIEVAKARTWVAVPCEVESSEVETQAGEDGATYRPRIVYRYEYAGRAYESGRYDFVEAYSSGLPGKQAVVDRYPPGWRTNCWVNHEAPEEAVLNRGLPNAMVFGLIPLVFVLIGVGGVVGTWRKPPSHGARSRVEPAAPVADGSERELRPAQTRTIRAVGAGIVALFWNGISWAILVSCYRDREWAGVVFLGLFALIGLGLLVAAVHQGLALANPRVSLRVRPGRLQRGGTHRLSWHTVGAVHRLRRLRITLEGRESATYRRGTATSTDRVTFARVELAELTALLDLRQGETVFALPAFAVPGFQAANNKVEWLLRVQGDVPFWPDVDDEFGVEIDGLEAGEAPVEWPAPPSQDMTRSADGALALRTEQGQIAFRPGATIVGAAGWSLPAPPRSAEVRLFWYTSGKGTRDVTVVASVPFAQAASQEVQPFQLSLPAEPWSVDGRLVSVSWALELVVQPGNRSVRRELVVSPDGRTLALPEPVPDPTGGVAGWRKFLKQRG